MASVEKETTFLLSFVTRATGEVLLYRERIAGSRSNAYTFANLHSHVPLLASLKDLKDLDPMLLADFEEPSEEEVSASSLQAATGLRLGKELKLRRKSKRVGWKVKSSFVQSFHYELAFDVDQDPVSGIRRLCSIIDHLAPGPSASHYRRRSFFPATRLRYQKHREPAHPRWPEG
jgi:hypothetical protein